MKIFLFLSHYVAKELKEDHSINFVCSAWLLTYPPSPINLLISQHSILLLEPAEAV
jgi:hypothetical protein